MSGPVPKRSETRRRTNEPKIPLAKPAGAAPAPELGLEDPHPLVVDLWSALETSAEAKWFTPAVWQRARVNMQVLSNLLHTNGRMSSQMYAAIQSDWKSLLIDPAEQRRLGIEVQSAPEVDDDAENADAAVLSLVDRLSESG